MYGREFADFFFDWACGVCAVWPNPNGRFAQMSQEKDGQPVFWVFRSNPEGDPQLAELIQGDAGDFYAFQASCAKLKISVLDWSCCVPQGADNVRSDRLPTPEELAAMVKTA